MDTRHSEGTEFPNCHLLIPVTGTSQDDTHPGRQDGITRRENQALADGAREFSILHEADCNCGRVVTEEVG